MALTHFSPIKFISLYQVLYRFGSYTLIISSCGTALHQMIISIIIVPGIHLYSLNIIKLALKQFFHLILRLHRLVREPCIFVENISILPLSQKMTRKIQTHAFKLTKSFFLYRINKLCDRNSKLTRRDS